MNIQAMDELTNLSTNLYYNDKLSSEELDTILEIIYNMKRRDTMNNQYMIKVSPRFKYFFDYAITLGLCGKQVETESLVDIANGFSDGFIEYHMCYQYEEQYKDLFHVGIVKDEYLNDIRAFIAALLIELNVLVETYKTIDVNMCEPTKNYDELFLRFTLMLRKYGMSERTDYNNVFRCSYEDCVRGIFSLFSDTTPKQLRDFSRTVSQYSPTFANLVKFLVMHENEYKNSNTVFSHLMSALPDGEGMMSRIFLYAYAKHELFKDEVTLEQVIESTLAVNSQLEKQLVDIIRGYMVGQSTNVEEVYSCVLKTAKKAFIDWSDSKLPIKPSDVIKVVDKAQKYLNHAIAQYQKVDWYRDKESFDSQLRTLERDETIRQCYAMLAGCIWYYSTEKQECS